MKSLKGKMSANVIGKGRTPKRTGEPRLLVSFQTPSVAYILGARGLIYFHGHAIRGNSVNSKS